MAPAAEELLPDFGELVRERVDAVGVELLLPQLGLKVPGPLLHLGKQRLPCFVSGPSSALDVADLLVGQVQAVDVDLRLGRRGRLAVEANVVDEARGQGPQRQEERCLHFWTPSKSRSAGR